MPMEWVLVFHPVIGTYWWSEVVGHWSPVVGGPWSPVRPSVWEERLKKVSFFPNPIVSLYPHQAMLPLASDREPPFRYPSLIQRLSLSRHSNLHRTQMSGGSIIPEYIRRIIHYPQMDIEYTMWQMVYLCASPKRVYRMTAFHKQTKNQWARDDPAFVTIISLFVVAAAISYGLAFRTGGFFAFMRLIFGSVFIDFLGYGAVISTIGWWLSNHYMRAHMPHSVEQTVEWLYAFDVHCNAFLPLFLLLSVVQYLFLPLLMGNGVIAALISIVLYVIAFTYYFYLTFLGYNALPFLHHTVSFLYPITLVFVGALISVLVGFNPTRFVMAIYHG